MKQQNNKLVRQVKTLVKLRTPVEQGNETQQEVLNHTNGITGRDSKNMLSRECQIVSVRTIIKGLKTTNTEVKSIVGTMYSTLKDDKTKLLWSLIVNDHYGIWDLMKQLDRLRKDEVETARIRNKERKTERVKINPSALIRELLKFDEDGKCINAFEVISRKDILLLAYETIKSKPGNMVRGSDQILLDGITKEWFDKASDQLLSEAYQPLPSRRVNIPKPNGKLRPLGISSPRDKIVQQAMKMVMEEILEPKFKDSSHGFRPKRGCHSALKRVRSWKGVTWIIEGDIKSYFDTIDHNLLATMLSEHFKEARLINLYWKLVQAGYVEWNKKERKFISTELGVPQGGIISPLLSNLVLHQLDTFIDYATRGNGQKKPNNGKKL